MEHVLVGCFDPRTKIEKGMLLERVMLMQSFNELGIDFIPVDCKWPRNFFVNHQGKIYTRKEHGLYADGGYILANPEFVLACSDVSKIDSEEIDNTDERFKKLRNLYSEDIFVLPPPDLSLNPNLSQHIDLVALPILERRVLFVDSLYYDRTARREVDVLCSRYNLKLERVLDDFSRPSYPCNSLVIREDSRMIVVTNSTSSEGFISKLKRYDLEVVGVPFSTNCSKGGSVCCATNTVPEDVDELEIFK